MGSRSSPTTTLVGIIVIVFLLQILTAVFGMSSVFALTWPLTHQPWTLVTSIFAHAGLQHLVGNAFLLLVVGIILERQTSPWRFLAFFIGVGALAGATQVTVSHLLGRQVVVVGSSGAIFGLLGYLIAGNPLTDSVADRISVSPRATVIVLGIIALGFTWYTRGRNVAMVAHFTGLFVGLLAGRAHILRTG